MSEKLAEYTETRLGISRVYSLFSDKLVYIGRSLGTSREMEFPLANLSPTYTKITLPAADPVTGVVVCAGGTALAFFFAWQSWGHVRYEPIVIFFLGLFAALAFLGATLVVRSRKKVVYAAFRSQDGLGFDIGQRGKFKDQFDGFVAKLVAEIERARREKAQAPGV